MFEDRGIHITEVGAYLKSTGFADSLPALILHSRTESGRERIDILAKPHDECEECAAGPNAWWRKPEELSHQQIASSEAWFSLAIPGIVQERADCFTFQSIWVRYVFVPDQLRTKLEKKAIRCIFTGYNEQKKGWRCVDPTTHKAYVSPHVVFDEASSWWSTENVALPDSKSLDTSMRAQLPERQEVSVGSDSGPVESPK